MKKSIQKSNEVLKIDNAIIAEAGTETLTNAPLANDSSVSVKGDEGQVIVKKKFTRSNYALLFTHAANNIASIFVSTFLVSYIYKISPNYVLNIGLFYLMSYLAMSVIYFLASFLVDRSNRVIIYKIALIIRGAFMLCVVLMGSDLAHYVTLAGLLYGFAEGCYWASYNVMKNELVSNKIMKNYSTVQQIDEKVISIIIPIVLGMLIDANSFKLTTIIVLVLLVIQFIVSLFIKSKRPENSSFKMKEFFVDIKNLGKEKSSFKLLYLATFFYGFTTIITPLNTVFIMFSFNSDFSLGIVTSIYSVLSVFLLIIINKLNKIGKHSFLNIITAIISPALALLLIFFTNQTTIIIYSLVCPMLSVVHAYCLDVYRNIILKKYGLYHDIAEHQCIIETLLCIARILSFGAMAIAGIIGAIYGVSGLLIATKVMLGIFIFSVTISNILFISVKNKIK